MKKTQTNKKMTCYDIFAANLRGLMAMKDVSPEEMSEYMGISSATFYKRLRRPYEFSMSNVEAAAKKLGAPAGGMISKIMEVEEFAG